MVAFESQAIAITGTGFLFILSQSKSMSMGFCTLAFPALKLCKKPTAARRAPLSLIPHGRGDIAPTVFGLLGDDHCGRKVPNSIGVEQVPKGIDLLLQSIAIVAVSQQVLHQLLAQLGLSSQLPFCLRLDCQHNPCKGIRGGGWWHVL